MLLISIFVVAWAVDPRVILSQPAWVKPLKFALSSGIDAATFLWLQRYVQGWPRWKRLAGAATGVALIAVQVMRGVTSHFNYATAFDGLVFSLMAGFIVVIAVLNLLLAVALLVQRLPDPVFVLALRLGVIRASAGMAVAFLITGGPTPSHRPE